MNPFYRNYMKRLIDIILSLIALILLAPLLLVIAILVYFKLGSPVLFTQDRPGKDEKIFKLYKFRTMTDEKDIVGNLLPDSVRLTKFGKFLRSTSLDELPELWNILIGDMSIVGPRPLLVQYLPLYNAQQKRRHEVRPGLTGFAQVNGRNAISWQEKFNYDVEYVKKMNLFLDIKIVFKTIKQVLTKDGISSETSTTMEAFKGNGNEKKILILANHDVGLYNFRKELLERLLIEGHEVYISCPYGDNIEKIINMGCHYINTDMNRHGMNPLHEIKLLNHYKEIMGDVKPDIIFGYTIKPNIYGAIAAKKHNIPFVANITGLGTAVENSGLLQKVIIQMYKYAFSKIKTVFFQNNENRQFFIDNNIAVGKHKMLPGSGVNLDHFYLQEYPSSDNSIEFVFISRIMKEKGIDQYLEAAEYITEKYPSTRFHICGFCEDEYEEILEDYQYRGIIKYHGMVSDVRRIIKNTHCTVHPTYYPEGLSNVLLESAASGRPIISTNRSGTREIIDNGINGYLVEERNSNDLIDKIEMFINLTHREKIEMGLCGREKAKSEFNRQNVVDKYINELRNVSEEK